MVADSDHQSIPARLLAERLRDLREREYRPLTQKQLARALSGSGQLSTATISLWEKPGSDRLPPPTRLAAYARLFCSKRSFTSGSPRLLRDEELAEPEREREAELYAELVALRGRAQSANTATPSRKEASLERSIWHFPDGHAVSIVCSDAPTPPSYAEPSHLNYSRYARHADLDALIEVFGQVKASNPASMIRILPPAELTQDFALNHLVMIGGKASDVAQYFAQGIPLPEAEETEETHVFTCKVGEKTSKFASLRDDGGVLVEDVGLIARGPHPTVPSRTVTMLSGITSRGVHGAALCFTNSDVRDANEQYLENAFGTADAFCILMRVRVHNNIALPPNLGGDAVRLYEWSARTGARW